MHVGSFAESEYAFVACRAFAHGAALSAADPKGASIVMGCATIALLVAVLAPLSMESEEFAVDNGDSKIGFRVTLARVADVDRRFSDFDATINNEADPTKKSSVTAIIKAASINRGDADLDSDRRGASFLASVNPSQIPCSSFQV